jgi:hypothetical protein
MVETIIDQFLLNGTPFFLIDNIHLPCVHGADSAERANHCAMQIISG